MSKFLIYSNHDSDKDRFPYILLFNVNNAKKFDCYKIQDKWPTLSRKIFCYPLKKTSKLPDEEALVDVEIEWHEKRANRLYLILNRKTKRRCWFIFLTKSYKKDPKKTYKQVFWLTQRATQNSGRSTYLPKIKAKIDESFTIEQSSNERFAWKFKEIKTIKKHLTAGDYLLKRNNKIISVVERKTGENLIKDLYNLEVLKMKLQDLVKFPHPLLVVEMNLENLLKFNKNTSSAFLTKAIIDLQVEFSQLPILFLRNRRLAQEWVQLFFQRIIDGYDLDS